MIHLTPVDQREKLARVYSERRQREVLLHIRYTVQEQNGCKVYELQRVEEME
jgi:hypothetical protein